MDTALFLEINSLSQQKTMIQWNFIHYENWQNWTYFLNGSNQKGNICAMNSIHDHILEIYLAN